MFILKNKITIYNFFLFLFIYTFLSCENSIKTVNSITNLDKSPNQTSKNVEIIYSENSKLVAKAVAPVIDVYVSDKITHKEMPKGLTLYFYDSLKNVESSIKSNYAIQKENENIWEARSNVVVVNRKGEQLNTEHLVWDEKNEKLYSDVFVKITTPDEILLGEGMESDQNFDKWHIKKPKGTYSIKK